MKEIKELNEMERYSMFMDKNQYCKDISITQLDLYIQCNPPPKKRIASYFVDVDKLVLKFIWRSRRSIMANTMLKEKNKVRKLTLHKFKTYFKATAT